MNALDPTLGKSGGPAVLHYGDGEFAVMSPGAYVLCAVTGARVPLDHLRYWSPELQEAYAGAGEALQRWRESRA